MTKWVFAAAVAWGFLFVVVVFTVFFGVKAAFHECLALPGAAQWELSNDAVSVRVESNREASGSYIKRREFAGCVWYWHENPLPRGTPWWRNH